MSASSGSPNPVSRKPALETASRKRVTDVRLHDAHLHLQDPRLQKALQEAEVKGTPPLAGSLETAPIAVRLTNGTSPDDWEAVARLVATPAGGTRRLAAYGVHPWKVDPLPADWEAQLRKHLAGGAASVGEIGLDHWIEPRDERLQVEVLEKQFALSREFALPPTLHCLRAWGLLMDILQAAGLPGRGFLVHGFGGSREVLFQLLDLGGYVSFSAYAADPKRRRMREAARACPADRLLVETDAPDMVPSESVTRFPLRDREGRRLHHPEELRTAYAFLAGLRGEDPEDLAVRVEANFQWLFG